MNTISNILILGGYGRAGKNVARLLAEHSEHHIIVAGRDSVKAKDCANELNLSFGINRVESKEVDAAERIELNESLDEVDLVIVCLPLNTELTENLIYSVLSSRCKTYLDISPSEEKQKTFELNQQLIAESNKTFVLDAGCEPGMPSVLIRFLKTINSEIKKVNINIVYRDRNMPEASIQDLLSHHEKGKVLVDGVWHQTKNSIKKINFSKGFGKLRTIPVWIPELENIHLTAEITDLEYRHAGINGVSNLVSLMWKSILRFILPIRFGVKLFKWAIKKFTKKPLGGLVDVEGFYGDEKVVIQAYHEDIYMATAIPAAVSSLMLLEHENNTAGIFFMNAVVDISEFVSRCNKMGFNINLV